MSSRSFELSGAQLSVAHRVVDVSSPQALLLGSGITVLGSLRTLGRAGVAARVTGGSGGLAEASRWYHPAPSLGDLTLGDYLESHIEAGTILIPCSDHWVSEIAHLPPGLRETYPASVGVAEVMDLFVDKGDFAKLLLRHGVSHPRTWLVDGATIPEDADRPERLFIKPRDSQSFVRTFATKALFPTSPEDLVDKLRLVSDRGIPVVLQEYVPGPPSNHYFIDGFLDRTHTPRGHLVRRRWRMHPYPFGNSSYMVTVPSEEAASAVTDIERLLGQAGYRGVYSAEFKKDEEDGDFKLLEVNARPWWFVEYAAAAGLDVLRMACLDARGLPVESVTSYQIGRRLVHPYHDVQACWGMYRRGELGLVDWMRSWLRADQPVFSWSDPLPGCRVAWRQVGDFLGRRLRLSGGAGKAKA